MFDLNPNLPWTLLGIIVLAGIAKAVFAWGASAGASKARTDMRDKAYDDEAKARSRGFTEGVKHGRHLAAKATIAAIEAEIAQPR